ncbi:MAG: hypothetical protein IPN33_07405 [Saprospiraceae bacterium]|nr:hypothetical protein [Saprospiraceae bacterium]
MMKRLIKYLQQLEEDEEDRIFTFEIQTIAHELFQSKKGKGRRSRPRKKRISLRELNTEILSHIDEWTSELAPLFSLTGLPPAEVAARLKVGFVEDIPALAQKTEQVLKYQPRLLGPISKSLFYTDHQQLLLKKMKQLPLRQRLRLRQCCSTRMQKLRCKARDLLSYGIVSTYRKPCCGSGFQRTPLYRARKTIMEKRIAIFAANTGQLAKYSSHWGTPAPAAMGSRQNG